MWRGNARKKKGVCAVLLSRSNVLLPNELIWQRRLNPVRAYRGAQYLSNVIITDHPRSHSVSAES